MEIAYRMYPLPNGTTYTEADIQTVDDVVRLFDYCQIWEAYITKEGWNYLIEKFGMNELYEADIRSGWFECPSVEEFAEAVACEMDVTEKIIKTHD